MRVQLLVLFILTLLGSAGGLPAQSGSVLISSTETPEPGDVFTSTVQLLDGQTSFGLLVEINGVPVSAGVTPDPSGGYSVTVSVPAAAEGGVVSVAVQPVGSSSVTTQQFQF